jgi:hypothetical protein
VDNIHDAIFGHSLTTYGIVWVIVGAILIFAGVFILSPVGVTAKIARWVGIVPLPLPSSRPLPECRITRCGRCVHVDRRRTVYGLSAHFDSEAVTKGS